MSAGVVAYIDGGARGNPGPAGYGVRIETTDGTAVKELNGAIGVTTNNAAEYHGLIVALSYLAAHGHLDVVIRSDSQLLTRQMSGQYRVRHPALQTLHTRALDLVAQLGRVSFEHVPRAHNARADELANAAMDNATVDTATRVSATKGLIIGIGFDFEEVARVDQLLRRYGDRFLRRVFTDAEAAYSRRRRFPAQHLAGRFAAKEATMKALGTGHSQGVQWRDVEVIRQAGPPQLQLHGGAQRKFKLLGASDSLVTMSHSRDLAMAEVVLVRR